MAKRKRLQIIRSQTITPGWIAVICLLAIPFFIAPIFSVPRSSQDKLMADIFSKKSGVSYFFSSSCLGGWKYVKNVEGEPQLLPDSDRAFYDTGNSAMLKNTSGQIFCAKFENGESLPAEIRDVKVKFSLAIIDDQPRNLKQKDFEEGRTLDSQPGEKGFFSVEPISIPELTPEISPGEESADTEITPEASSEESPAAPLEVITEPEPEIVAPEPPPAELPPVETSNGEVSVNSFKWSLAYLMSAISKLVLSSLPAADEFDQANNFKLNDVLRVLYTKDGENWHSLGSITRNNWSDVSFEVPIFTAEEMNNLQISVVSLLTLDTTVTIYLDSIWLEIPNDSSAFAFIKEIGENILDILNGEKNLSPESTPMTEPETEEPPVPVIESTPTPTPKIKQKKIKYEVDSSGQALRPILNLNWYPKEKFGELVSLNKNKSFSEIEVVSKDGILSVSGSCQKKYFVLLLYRDQDDYATDPFSAVYNSAFPCGSGVFEQPLANLNVDSGVYYLLVAEQDDGLWSPASVIRKVEIDKREVEE